MTELLQVVQQSSFFLGIGHQDDKEEDRLSFPSLSRSWIGSCIYLASSQKAKNPIIILKNNEASNHRELCFATAAWVCLLEGIVALSSIWHSQNVPSFSGHIILLTKKGDDVGGKWIIFYFVRRTAIVGSPGVTVFNVQSSLAKAEK